MTDPSGSGRHHSWRATLHPGRASLLTGLEQRSAQVGGTRLITIARQIGAGAESLPQRLVASLNTHMGPDQVGWSVWDKELVDKVAADYHIPGQLIEKLEHSGYSWIDTLVSSLGGMPEEFAILHRLEESVRRLADAGRVVLVGHGAVFMTGDVPGAVHIRLVAPLAYRVANMARRLDLSMQEASTQLKKAQRSWVAFLRRYWPTRNLAPETFMATLNTAQLDEDHLVGSIIALAT